jgi:ferredoxin
MDIPTMIRQIEEKRFEEAIITVKKDIALPAVLGRICQAPCEKGCRRRLHDNPVSICFLKRFVADVDLALDSPYRPAQKNRSGKRVAIVGTGPTGLSAAYYLLQAGHDCHLYDKNPLPGGMLRYGVPENILPKSVLDSEIERISELGAEFRMEHSLGREMEFEELKNTYDALVLALGTIDPLLFEDEHLKLTNRGLAVNRKTFETTIPGVFAGGNVLGESRMAIRATAHGKDIAVSVEQFLSGLEVAGSPKRFNSLMGKIEKEEIGEFLKEAQEYNRIVSEGGVDCGFLEAEAVKESTRCFHCECRKQDSCRLRQYSEEYDADQRRYRFDQRRKFEKNIQHEHVIYEPGKCLKCGMCVRITEKEKEQLGLAFVNRGFEARVETPFNEPLNRGLLKTAKECIEACPTAALSWRVRSDKERNPIP